jgi:hypothetical protein
MHGCNVVGVRMTYQRKIDYLCIVGQVITVLIIGYVFQWQLWAIPIALTGVAFWYVVDYLICPGKV